jgi:predicted XRE-type DNA-binding protein
MRVRSELIIALTELIKKRGMTQTDAAKMFGVTQPRISDLMRGKVELFSLDALVDMAAIAGLAPHVKIKKAA